MDRNCVYCYNPISDQMLEWQNLRNICCRMLKHRIKNNKCSEDIKNDTTIGELSNSILYYYDNLEKFVKTSDSRSQQECNRNNLMLHLRYLHKTLIEKI